MFKKIILFVASFAVVTVAYLIYQSQDDTPARARRPVGPLASRSAPMAQHPSTQPVDPDEGKTFSFRGMKVPPGRQPMVRVFDEKGNARIVFQASRWQPISDNEFNLTEPSARLLLPGGQVAYVRADEGQIIVQRDDSDNYNPKRGWFRGHVRLIIDRTKPQWRKSNPNLADPEQHPEAVVKLWLDDVTFDLDLARLDSKGPILVQSPDATIEGRGLTLIWNEVNRRIKLLRISEGRKALVRTKGLVQFGISGDEAVEVVEPTSARVNQAAGKPVDVPPSTIRPVTPNVAVAISETYPPADEATEEIEEALPLAKPDKPPVKAKDTRIDTYEIVFRDNVVVEQKEGIRVAGRLKANMLKLLRDFGPTERSAVEHVSETQPSETATQPSEVATQPSHDKSRERPRASQWLAGYGIDDPSESAIELRWRGELVVTPVSEDVSEDGFPKPPKGNRFHVEATGEPVEIHDRQTGDVTCLQLRYHDETQQVWLAGSREAPVQMTAGSDREVIGEKVFLDRKAGIARVEGPGRMIQRKGVEKEEDDWPECMKVAKPRRASKTAKDQSPATAPTVASRPSPKVAPQKESPAAESEKEDITVSWKRSVEIAFGTVAVQRPNPQGGPPMTKQKEYIKSAVFDGGVFFRQSGQSISADHVDVTFVKPTKGLDLSRDRQIAADHVIASGKVRMVNDEDMIACDRLDVEMTTDDTGRNVPKIARAFGHIVARQGESEIRAADELVAALASVPVPITPQEQERFEAAARRCEIEPGSDEWIKAETRLRNRREIIITTMKAREQVRIISQEEDLNLTADRLECSFDRGEDIERALVVGREDRPAWVETSDFYIRGPQISLDMTKKSVEVPGAGLLRFLTKQDLDGRRLDEPRPVVVAWKRRMSLRTQDNVGAFHGQVRAVSENMALDCQELWLRFQDLPKEPVTTQPETGPDSRWIVGRVLDSLAHDKDKDNERTISTSNLSGRLRKRLASARAVGDAVILSRSYDEVQPARGVFSSLLARLVPTELLPPADTQPAMAENRKLVSGVRVAGPLIVTDLINEHLVVEGAGNLLIEDYHLPQRREEKRPSETTLLQGSSIATMSGTSPSLTFFQWKNSMSFLNNRNVAVFDYRVTMKHLSGSEILMALSGEVATAIKADMQSLEKLKGRNAEMTCDNLLAEFIRDDSQPDAGPSPLSGATRLKAFRATGPVRIQETQKESHRSVQGTVVSYNGALGMVNVTGSPQLPAQIVDLDKKTGRLRGLWRGKGVEWNLKTNEIVAEDSRVMATGR